jgi:hypothetical protein
LEQVVELPDGKTHLGREPLPEHQGHDEIPGSCFAARHPVRDEDDDGYETRTEDHVARGLGETCPECPPIVGLPETRDGGALSCPHGFGGAGKAEIGAVLGCPRQDPEALLRPPVVAGVAVELSAKVVLDHPGDEWSEPSDAKQAGNRVQRQQEGSGDPELYDCGGGREHSAERVPDRTCASLKDGDAIEEFGLLKVIDARQGAGQFDDAALNTRRGSFLQGVCDGCKGRAADEPQEYGEAQRGGGNGGAPPLNGSVHRVCNSECRQDGPALAKHRQRRGRNRPQWIGGHGGADQQDQRASGGR